MALYTSCASTDRNSEEFPQKRHKFQTLKAKFIQLYTIYQGEKP